MCGPSCICSSVRPAPVNLGRIMTHGLVTVCNRLVTSAVFHGTERYIQNVLSCYRLEDLTRDTTRCWRWKVRAGVRLEFARAQSSVARHLQCYLHSSPFPGPIGHQNPIECR